MAELAAQVDADYAGREVLLVGVLKGAVMFMADFARALRTPGVDGVHGGLLLRLVARRRSGVVRILKDLDRDIADRHVLVVEDIIDSGLTLSWLLRNMRSRGPASVEVCALLRKPEAAKVEVPVKYVGFDIPPSSSSATAWTTPSATATCPSSALLKPEVYTAAESGHA